MCECNIQCLDMKTPRNVYLTAFYKRSFAHHTVKNRMPIILTQIIDSLARNMKEINQVHGQEGEEDMKAVIGELSKLKYEIQTNKPLKQIISTAPDAQEYNRYIASQCEQNGHVTFFSAIWLLSECYMYRRIRQAFELTNKLKTFDPFLKQKQESYFQALELITNLAQKFSKIRTHSQKNIGFSQLLKINLWGNKCDLSLSNGQMTNDVDNLFNLEKLDSNILCDDTEKIWSAISSCNCSTIDIVFDNAGYELFTDLCLADFLIANKLALKVRLYVKTIPWFISDVMTHDFYWMLDQLKNHKNEYVKDLGVRWSKYIEDEIWALVEEDFWTLPMDFTHMRDVNPELYRNLGEADLIVFKGDLNYRKLFGEKNWNPTTPVDEALQNFHPSKICSLRTIKADIVCGLEANVVEKIEMIDDKWMETGEYGLIQFSSKVVPL